MPRYVYKAKSSPHKTIEGDIEAESEQEVIHILSKTGYFPVSVKAEDFTQSTVGFRRRQRVTKQELTLFTRQLSSLIESGVTILNSLTIISNQTPNKQFKVILRDIATKIQNGQSFSDSLTSFPHLFPALYAALVHTGEMSGSLNETLKRLADYLEKEEEFRNSIRAALTYPIFVLAVGVMTILVLLLFVVPRLVSMFEDMGQALPLSTQILVNTSGFLRTYGWAIIIFLWACIFFLRRLCRMPQGRLAWDSFKLKLPLVGPIAMKTEISRMMRTLSLLIAGAMPITSSLEIARLVLSNQIVASTVQKIKEKISSGARLSEALKSAGFFNDFVINIIAIGEETGALEKSLLTISNDYEKDVDRALKLFARLLEPVLILIMGIVVGFIVLSMLLPIFQINLIVS